MNIVIAMMTLKIISRVSSAYSKPQFGQLKSNQKEATYLFRVVENVLEGKNSVLIFQTLSIHH